MESVLAGLLLLLVGTARGRVFERCELVRELSQPRYRIPAQDLATWVCIARHESQYNTSAVGHLNADGSGDHGLFQISDQYWCSPPGVGLACGLNCDQLEDDDIKDDVICARRIYRATKRRTGDGFTAWAVYGHHCRGDVGSYLEGCEEDVEDEEEDTSDTSRIKTSSVLPEDTKGRSDKTTSRTDTPSKTSTVQFHNFEITTKPYINLVATRRSFSPDSKLKDRSIVTPQAPTSNRPSFALIPRRGASSPITASDEDSAPISASKLSSASRSPGTSSAGRRPTSTREDSAAAWLRIHNDPRFLDEFP